MLSIYVSIFNESFLFNILNYLLISMLYNDCLTIFIKTN